MLIFALFLQRINPCSETQYWVENLDGSTSCEDCPSCLPGQGLSEECGQLIKSSAFVICEPCQPKFSFSSKHDTSMCTPCSSCAEDQVVQRNCTPEWDIKCAKRCSSMDRYTYTCVTIQCNFNFTYYIVFRIKLHITFEYPYTHRWQLSKILNICWTLLANSLIMSCYFAMNF